MISSFSESFKPPASSWCRILFPGWACVPSLLRDGVEVAVPVSWGGHSFFPWKTEAPYSSSGNLVAHWVHSSFLYFSLLLIFFYFIPFLLVSVSHSLLEILSSSLDLILLAPVYPLISWKMDNRFTGSLPPALVGSFAYRCCFLWEVGGGYCR